MVNIERLWGRLTKLSTFGKEESGGITRLSFTAEERAAQDELRAYMEQAGLAVRFDAVGNLFGRKEGFNPLKPVILIGSHIDSVYNGGNFDGPLGVLTALEVLQTMKDQGIETEHPIELVATKDEEGARFSFGMIGSRGLAGTLQVEDLHRRDKQGVSISEAMHLTGLDPAAIRQAAIPKEAVKAYLEVHIEQGKVLEKENLSVGIVNAMFGLVWLEFCIQGEPGHAGATPMNLRRDALTAAAQIIGIIEREAAQTGTTVGTVGQLRLFPGGINIIPGKVEFTLDLRDTDPGVLARVESLIVSQAEKICAERAVELQVKVLQRIEPAFCSTVVQAAISEAFLKLGLRQFSMVSGAGHDGMQFAHLWPIGMIFVRSKDGISHSPEEWSSQEDCFDGAKVLYETVLELAGPVKNNLKESL